MAIEIITSQYNTAEQQQAQRAADQAQTSKLAQQLADQKVKMRHLAQSQNDLSREKLDNIAQEMNSAMASFNRKLSYSVNEDLDMVVVKVIDRNTDRVIKELPPAELQRLHKGLKEAIGMIIAQEI